jgi:choline dehydrogenase-like flavoprotein
MRLTVEEGRTTGVIFEQGGPTHARARREVILAAGAIGSPQILQLSGIGPGALSQKMGIAPVLDQPGIGGNLQDHLQLRMIYRLENAKTLNQRANSLMGKAGIALEYALTRSGPMSMAPSQLCAYTRSSPDVATPDLEYHIQPLSLEAFGQPLHDFPAVTMSVCNLRPESRGNVEIASPDWRAHPTIAPNYLSTEGDRLVAGRSIRVTRRIMATETLSPHRPEEVKPGPGPDDDAALAKAASDIGTTIFHPVGTCRMGVDDGAVVDGRLRLNGLDGLRVVDASVMPRITSGNTNSPVLMIAEKAAEMILEDAKA